MGKKLIIGSSGQIGTELILALAKIYGKDQIIATDINPKAKDKIDGILFHQMDVLDVDHLESVVKDNQVSEVDDANENTDTLKGKFEKNIEA